MSFSPELIKKVRKIYHNVVLNGRTMINNTVIITLFKGENSYFDILHKLKDYDWAPRFIGKTDINDECAIAVDRDITRTKPFNTGRLSMNVIEQLLDILKVVSHLGINLNINFNENTEIDNQGKVHITDLTNASFSDVHFVDPLSLGVALYENIHRTRSDPSELVSESINNILIDLLKEQ
jgi:hypothetical protein